MYNIVLVATLALFLSWSNFSFSETCYTVEGEVKTVNNSEENQSGSQEFQSGSIELLLLDENDNEVFRETGTILGKITNSTLFTMAHFASFNDGSTFLTSDDVAKIIGVRKLAENGIPCSFKIHETITNIVTGSGFFSNVNDVEIHGIGYISACIAEGENENEFELSGYLCVD